MTDPNVTPGKGTTLKLTVSSTPTLIGQITNIQPPKVSQVAIDTTDLDATWKTCIGSVLDGGEVSFTLNWDASNAVHGNVWTAAKSAAPQTWLVTCTDTGAATIGFSGVCTSFEWQQATIENIIMVNVTIKVDGAVTITP